MKKPLDILDKLIDTAASHRMLGLLHVPRGWKPSELVMALSEDDRAILKELTSTDTLKARPDLIEIDLNTDARLRRVIVARPSTSAKRKKNNATERK